MIAPSLNLIFFLSGFSALIFETLWFHQAGLVLGNSVWSASIVLAAFMMGMALGNGLAVAERRQITSPGKVFIALQIIIALFGLSAVAIFPHLTKVLAPFFRLFLGAPALLNGARMLVALAVMSVPSMAMGATLPVMMKTPEAADSRFGQTLGNLYGWNTVGAMAGVMAAEFFCIRKFGLLGTGFIAAAGSLAAAATALLIFAPDRNLPGRTAFPKKDPLFLRLPSSAAFLLSAAFLGGFAFLALEVVWFRFLMLFFNPVGENFAMTLGVVLAGLGLGGAMAATLFAWRPRAENSLIPLLCANGILITLLYGVFSRVLSSGIIAVTPPPFDIALCAVVMIFPVACLSGAILPLLGKSLRDALREEVSATGLLMAANTLGGVSGALAAGSALIPTAGIEKAFFILACLFPLAAFCVAAGQRTLLNRRAAPFSAAMICLLFGSLAWFPFGLMERVFLKIPVMPDLAEGMKRIAVKEGMNETIQYLRMDLLGRPYYHYLVTDGYSMASTAAWARRYMDYFVYWPQAVNPRIKRALLIGYGCGVTAKALTDTATLERIDVVDTSRDILRMSSAVFPSANDNPLSDPRVRVHVEDGRFYLLTAAETYDLITGEPPPIKAKGVINLYTEEFFRLVKNRLSPGGIVTYWLPVDQLTAAETKSVVKGFCNVFGDCSLWTANPLMWMLAGTKSLDQKADLEDFARQWNDPVVARKMRDLRFGLPRQFGSLFIADGDRLIQWLGDALPLVDNYPKRLSSRMVEGGLEEPDIMSLMEPGAGKNNFAHSAFIKTIWPDSLRRETLQSFDARNIAFAILMDDESVPLKEKLWHCLNDPLLAPYLVFALDSDPDAQNILAQALEKNEPVDLKNAGRHLAAKAVLEGDYETAERDYSQLVENALSEDRERFETILDWLRENLRTENLRTVSR